MPRVVSCDQCMTAAVVAVCIADHPGELCLGWCLVFSV